LQGAAAAVIFTSMSKVTRILSALEQGNPSAAAQLLPLASAGKLVALWALGDNTHSGGL